MPTVIFFSYQYCNFGMTLSGSVSFRTEFKSTRIISPNSYLSLRQDNLPEKDILIEFIELWETENSFSIAMQRGPRSGEARSTRSSEGHREARPWRLASGGAESREWRWRQTITVAPESSGLTTARYRWQLYLSTPGLSYWTETEGGGRLAYTAPFTWRASGGRQSITPSRVPGPSSCPSPSLLKGPAPHSPALTSAHVLPGFFPPTLPVQSPPGLETSVFTFICPLGPHTAPAR